MTWILVYCLYQGAEKECHELRNLTKPVCVHVQYILKKVNKGMVSFCVDTTKSQGA